MRFAWVLHPFDPEFQRENGLSFGLLAWLWARLPRVREGAVRRRLVFPFRRVPEIVTLDGRRARGRGYFVPLPPSRILSEQTLALELIEKACRTAEAWGARVVGLAELTGVIGSRGLEIARRTSATVTTGAAYTVYASVESYELAMEQLYADPWAPRLTVVGLPDTRALAAARLLAARGARLTLVGDPAAPYVRRYMATHFAECRDAVEWMPDLDAALRRNRVIFAASTAGQTIDPARLASGTLVVDIGQPWDLTRPRGPREELLLLDGGVVSLPGTTTDRCRLPWFPRHYINACLAEPAIIALEGRREPFSLGRELDVRDLEEVGKLAGQQGFSGRNLFHRYRPLPPEAVARFRQVFRSQGA
jgi:putrescine aminotransferase